jgi:hypothetical protein
MDRPSGEFRIWDCENRFLDELLMLWVVKFGGFVSVTPRIMELPRYEADGAPAGVKLAAEEGGGASAGVVDGLAPKKLTDPPRELREGVEGGELSLGTSNRLDMFVEEAGARRKDVVIIVEGGSRTGRKRMELLFVFV